MPPYINDVFVPSTAVVPIEIQGQLGRLYKTLQECPELLKAGPEYGLQIGLSEVAKEMLDRMYGHGSAGILSQCPTIKRK